MDTTSESKPNGKIELPEVLASVRSFLQKNGITKLLQAGESPHIDGVFGGASAAVLAAVTAELPTQNVLIVTPSQKTAETLMEDFALFSTEHTLFFPWISESEVQRFAENSASDSSYLATPAAGERLAVLKSLQARTGAANHTAAKSGTTTGQRSIVFAPIQAMLKPCPSPETLQRSSLRINRGDSLPLDFLTGWLVDHGFHSTSAVTFPGEFFVRGGLLDIYGLEMENPIRIEFFGDEVDSLREFDLETQRSLNTLDSVDVTAFLSLTAKANTEETTKPVDLTAYLGEGTCCFLLEPEEVQLQATRFFQSQEKSEGLLQPQEVFRHVLELPLFSASTLGNGTFGETFSLATETVERFSGDFSKVKGELEKFGHGQDVYLLCPNEAEVKRLSILFEDTWLNRNGQLHCHEGVISEGFRLVASHQLVLSSDALFTRQEVHRSVPRRKVTKIIDSFSELHEGDYVVHLSHGIGIYRGIQLIEPQKGLQRIAGKTQLLAKKSAGAEEHLVIEFKDGVLVYVPTSKIALVQKYINGGGGAAPKLSTYGGKSWGKQKQAVAQAVLDIAGEMLEIQALRQSRPGIAFPINTKLQKDFDASFPYTETPDQQAAIEAIRQDMAQARPMDRLLCGDVGFGKTEVAMRAAFTAVEAGYQVAVMVPTTVLAEQHYRTFTERMASFPVRIASLSRFSTPAEQKETLQALKAGDIDIVIGTHRLASKDVEFFNLGLVVIDEEQRFGVEVKEALKRLRATVDVLTMTATPIPRTLHMSLLGLRDISSLETPPAERLPVETHVARYEDELVKNAIQRELERDGQVYFVHNRVQDIGTVANQLRMLVPEARIVIGHAQMPEHELEHVMLKFVRHQCDVLLSTTIVESGLDIPNANTIFIDMADNYGLADLHQLRGRVGRLSKHAYCYALLKHRGAVSSTAMHRLKALEEFSHLGAGFNLAMRDLEIRGAGNILGTKQSGEIAMVGYELYCDLLEAAVRRLKKVPPRETVDVEVDLPVTAYIPHEYVPNMRTKIDFYRRLSRMTDVQQIRDFADELRDRFGKIPPVFLRLLKIFQIRILAHRLLIYSIHKDENFVVLRFYSRKAIEPLVQKPGWRDKFRLRIVDDSTAYLPLDEKTATAPADSAKLLFYIESLLQENEKSGTVVQKAPPRL